jgi:hypothetical protein
MRYIKSFEAKKQKNDNLSVDDQISRLRDEWELADERSYISFDKFFDNHGLCQIAVSSITIR